MEQPELTARFENMASEHDGETVLAFRRRFSEDRVVRYRLLRDEAFNVSGARSRRFGVLTAAMTCARCTSSRKRPETSASSLPAGMGCGATGAICTEDDRLLSNSNSDAVKVPMAISVADATEEEAAKAELSFGVTHRPRPGFFLPGADPESSFFLDALLERPISPLSIG